MMNFSIYEENGSGCEYINKAHFFAKLEEMVDACIANGGTEFNLVVEADAPCFEMSKREV